MLLVMAKEKKVQQITDMEVDFAQWYTDICRKAELVEYASVKGFTILQTVWLCDLGEYPVASWTPSSRRPAMRMWQCRS